MVCVYLQMYRLIHAFTCTGILPRQYIHFSLFAHLGTVGKWYIDQGTHESVHVHICVHIIATFACHWEENEISCSNFSAGYMWV